MARRAGSSIKSLIRREETTLRLGGHGAEWHMSWAADDRQFVSLGGGMGWSDNPERIYISRLFAISKGPQDATFQDVPGYPDLLQLSTGENSPPAYTCFGTFALDGRIYQFLNTLNRRILPRARHTSSVPSSFIRPTTGAPGATRMGPRRWCGRDGRTAPVRTCSFSKSHRTPSRCCRSCRWAGTTKRTGTATSTSTLATATPKGQ